MGVSGRIAKAFQTNAHTPLLALVALLLGLFAVLVTPREEEPQINVTMANVLIAFPGAGSVDVQNMVAAPAERVLSQVGGIVHTIDYHVRRYSTYDPERNKFKREPSEYFRDNIFFTFEHDRAGLLTTPLRDRFGIPIRLDFYTDDELLDIVKRGSRVMKVEITEDGAREIAKRPRGTPRSPLSSVRQSDEGAPCPP